MPAMMRVRMMRGTPSSEREAQAAALGEDARDGDIDGPRNVNGNGKDDREREKERRASFTKHEKERRVRFVENGTGIGRA